MTPSLSENNEKQNSKPVSIKFNRTNNKDKILSRHVSFDVFQVKSDFMDTHLDNSARFR